MPQTEPRIHWIHPDRPRFTICGYALVNVPRASDDPADVNCWRCRNDWRFPGKEPGVDNSRRP